jgi:hypothetical protein
MMSGRLGAQGGEWKRLGVDEESVHCNFEHSELVVLMFNMTLGRSGI